MQLLHFIRVRGAFVRQSTHILFFFAVIWLSFPSGSSWAQERLIAVIMANSQPRYQLIHSAFTQGLDSYCNADCKIYVQTPNADTMSLRNAVRKAVALGADLIVTYGPMATLAAQAEVPPMPTLFADVYDPVGLEVVSAKTRTGRNMTGVRGDAPVQALLKYFSETTQANKLAILFEKDSPEGALQAAVLTESAQKRGVEIQPLVISDPKDHMTPLKKLAADTDGIFLANSEYSESHLDHVLAYVASKRVPAITQRAGAAEAGAFMVLETSAMEQGEKLAEMAKQVLDGIKTSDIPMYKPRNVSFVVNLKAARQYQIDIPIQTLSIASRVIR